MNSGKSRRGETATPGPPPAGSGGLVEFLELGRALGAVDLALGVPGWPPPPPGLLDAAQRAIRDGDNQYEHPDGNRLLRGQVAAARFPSADPETEVTITVGATEALHVALLATLRPGDEVVVTTPCYEHFFGAVALAGGILRTVPTAPPDWRWEPADLAAAFGPRTRVLLVNTPANPTGRVLGPAEWAEIDRLCQRWDVTVISDEVYSAFVFDGGRHISAADVPGVRERCIVVGSLSKSHAVSGWRLGYLWAPAAVTAALRRVHLVVSCGTAGPLQRAVAEAGPFRADWDPGPGMQLRRDRAVAMFSAAGLGCRPSAGGCYLFADIRAATGEDSATFTRRVVRQHGVLVVPGRLFLPAGEADPGFVRIAYNRGLETLDEAERRIRGGLGAGPRTAIGGPRPATSPLA